MVDEVAMEQQFLPANYHSISIPYSSVSTTEGVQ
jgi:hypothetical protein